MNLTFPFLALLLLWGCASSQGPVRVYDASTGTTSFESPRVVVGHVDMRSGLVGGQRVMAQAFASCIGQGCVPSEVDLAFFNDSSADLNLDYRRVQLDFDGESMEWEDPSRIHESPRGLVPRGEFMRVPLSRTEFERFVTARQVAITFGLTGTAMFRMPLERREPLRAFVALFHPDSR